LLDQALAYESVEPPSLTGFLAWIDRDAVEVKRRVDEGADEVRVMTVHGAKGLEAPIVMLPDTARRDDGRNPPQILRLENGEPAWKCLAEEMPPALRDAERHRRAGVRAENMRLLYVALTRARSRLIVCGAGLPAAPGEGWHALVEAAMLGLGPEREAGPDGDVLRLSHNWSDLPATPAAPEPLVAALAFAARPAPPRAAERPRTPSGLGGAHVVFAPGVIAEDEAAARARGEALHRLLEVLHRRPEADWPALARRVLGPADPDELLAEAAAVVRAPELGFVFAPGTLAEVDVAAALPELGGARILGRIDRLVLGPDRAVAVDFKSNRVLPDRPEAVPEGILRQLGAYAAALARLWPGRRVETAIVWTRGPVLMPVPAALTAPALARALLDPSSARP
jgi:ATP-dependent helicase/nuclease subunit A